MSTTTKQKNAGYSGFGELESLQVQKSEPLYSLIHQSDLTLSQLQLLDAYLGRINSHNPSIRTVRFEKGDLEHIIGVDRIRKEDLEKRLEGLYCIVRLDDLRDENHIKNIVLFESTEAIRDPETQLWSIELTCTEKAKQYIFNLENIKYFQYGLKAVISLKSRYSFSLFLYLEHQRFIRKGKNLTWTVPLDFLRSEIACTASRYDEYKYLSRDILKKCQKELAEKSDCHFTYEASKTGRKVTGVTITLEPREKRKVKEKEKKAEQTIEEKQEDKTERLQKMIMDAISEEDESGKMVCAFELPEIKYITDMVMFLKKEDFPGETYTNLNNKRIEFVQCQYLTYKLHAEKEDIKKPGTYFAKMIENAVTNCINKRQNAAAVAAAREKEEKRDDTVALKQMEKLRKKMEEDIRTNQNNEISETNA